MTKKMESNSWIEKSLKQQNIDDRLASPDIIKVTKKLEEIARKGKNSKIYYEEIAQIVHLNLDDPHDRETVLGRMLGIISQHEKDCGRPLLSAIVVTKETKMPGSGFYGFNDTNISNEKFWIKEINKVWEYWRKH